MILLMIITGWLIQVQINRLVRADASQTLQSCRQSYEHFLTYRTRELLLRASSIPSDSRFKSVAQLGDPGTMRALLRELLEEKNTGFLMYLTPDGEQVAMVSRQGEAGATGSPGMPPDFLPRAREGHAVFEASESGGRLYEIASVPVILSGTVYGVLCLADQLNSASAAEISRMIGCEIAFVGREGTVVSSLAGQAARHSFAGNLSEGALEPPAERGPDVDATYHVKLNGEHYIAGSFVPVFEGNSPGHQVYLLSSYEQYLLILRRTQAMLGVVAFGGILLGGVVAWIAIRGVMKPLRRLRNGVEEVGQGQLGHHIEISSGDEIGELAVAFNTMTDNLNASREELENSVTTLKDTRARLLQSEKLSAVGEFIAGVAHELNNPLTVLVGYAQLLEESDLDEAYKQEVRQMADSADRCHNIVQNLLSFARQRPPEWMQVDLHDLLDATLNFLTYELRTSNIESARKYAADLPCVMADPHQLQQIFLNIANNARQAMEEAEIKGTISFHTSFTKEFVQVEIRDTGPGIKEENREKIFDPFFTTKEQGKGTGLGLSVSYGIIKEHGGEIMVESEVGVGTTFRIQLPVAAVGSEPPAGESTETVETAAQIGSGLSVLVVDDEKGIIELASKMLCRMGYEVDTACDGRTALELLSQRRYDVILSDWKMPGVSGQELYQRLPARDAAMASAFIFMTGDVLNERMQTFIADCGASFLAKPFSLDEFRAVMELVPQVT
jgi:signal transduction histidine kinase